MGSRRLAIDAHALASTAAKRWIFGELRSGTADAFLWGVMPEWEDEREEEVEIEFTEPIVLFAIPPPDSGPPPPDSEFPPDDHFDIADAIDETLSEAPPAPRESGPVLGEYFKTAC